MAGIGGALMFGALPRLEKRPRVRNAVLLGLGLAILANSRPYEGLGASIPVAAALLWRPSRRALVPVAIAVSITGAATAYYCWRTTDHPFLMAHQLNRETYAMARFFLWEQPRSEPIYRHAVMRQFYTEWEPNFQNAIGQNTLSGWLSAAVGRSEVQWGFYLGWALSVPLPMLPWTLRDRRMRFWLFACQVFLLGLALERYTQPHYRAPFVGVVAKVVWALEMNPAEDRELKDYFRGRKIWVVDADEAELRLTDARPAVRLQSNIAL